MKNKKILIIAAHPDDEVLGCGGTIAKLTPVNSVYSLILGEGMTARDLEDYKTNLQQLKQSALESQKILGIKETYFEKFPDNRFDEVALLDIVKKVEEYIFKIKPNIVFTHHHSDLNVDHRMTFQAVLTACRPQPNFFHPDIYCFEVPSSTDWQVYTGEKIFKPNIYINISDTIDLKLKALALYKSEMREYPHSRSLEGVRVMAKDRGVKVGKYYAEAFSLIRSIQDDFEQLDLVPSEKETYEKSLILSIQEFDLKKIQVIKAIKENENHKREIWIIFNENLDYRYKTYEPVSYSHHSEWWEHAFDKELIFVISYETQIIGYIRLTKLRTESKEINEISIAISKKYQNLGIGSYALNIFETTIKEMGINQIIALTDVKNKLGMRFFEKNSYEKAHMRYIKNL